MRICFLGAGKLATQLSIGLTNAGHEIVQVYSRSIASAYDLYNLINSTRKERDGNDCHSLTYTNECSDIVENADLYVCALKDSVITQVLDGAKKRIQGKMIVHTAGSIDMSVLSPYTGNYGVLYPLQTFSKTKEVDFSKVPFFIEGSNVQMIDCLKNIVDSLSDKCYELSSEERRKVHLSAVFVSNFANHSYTLGAELLKSTGVPFDVLLPLIDETAAKVHSLTPIEAQSGPAVRNDQNVMEEHRTMLPQGSYLRRIYDLMSESIYAASSSLEKN